MEVVRTLVYVVPLTLLIWVWAQDQQIDVRSLTNIPVRIEHFDGQKIVTVLQTSTGDEVTRRGDSILATLTFRGPRIGLNYVLRSMSDEQRSAMFRIQLRERTADQMTVSLREQLNQLAVLSDVGVSVSEVSPSDLVVRIEDRKQVEARIVPADIDPEALAGPVEFDPPTVTLSGPTSAINQLIDPDGQVTLEVELTDDPTPGEHVESLVVRVPDALAARITPESIAVAATYTLREKREEPLELPFAVPIVAEVAAAWNGEVVFDLFDPSVLANLRVRGPPEMIALLRASDPRLRSQIKAVVPSERDDDTRSGQQVTREVEIELPEGLVLDQPPPRVTFRIRRIDGL